jgi:hypothetical protein
VAAGKAGNASRRGGPEHRLDRSLAAVGRLGHILPTLSLHRKPDLAPVRGLNGRGAYGLGERAKATLPFPVVTGVVMMHGVVARLVVAHLVVVVVDGVVLAMAGGVGAGAGGAERPTDVSVPESPGCGW